MERKNPIKLKDSYYKLSLKAREAKNPASIKQDLINVNKILHLKKIRLQNRLKFLESNLKNLDEVRDRNKIEKYNELIKQNNLVLKNLDKQSMNLNRLLRNYEKKPTESIIRELSILDGKNILLHKKIVKKIRTERVLDYFKKLILKSKTNEDFEMQLKRYLEKIEKYNYEKNKEATNPKNYYVIEKEIANKILSFLKKNKNTLFNKKQESVWRENMRFIFEKAKTIEELDFILDAKEAMHGLFEIDSFVTAGSQIYADIYKLFGNLDAFLKHNYNEIIYENPDKEIVKSIRFYDNSLFFLDSVLKSKKSLKEKKEIINGIVKHLTEKNIKVDSISFSLFFVKLLEKTNYDINVMQKVLNQINLKDIKKMGFTSSYILKNSNNVADINFYTKEIIKYNSLHSYDKKWINYVLPEAIEIMGRDITLFFEFLRNLVLSGKKKTLEIKNLDITRVKYVLDFLKNKKQEFVRKDLYNKAYAFFR